MRDPKTSGNELDQGITAEILLSAYRLGVFPMAEAQDDPTIHWINPKRRGILPLDRFHVPRRLARTIRSGLFATTADRAFNTVIRACAEPTPSRPNTWLNAKLIELYGALFRRGHAHSIETWRDGMLVGGLYGVSIGAAFFGESMFSRTTDASKVALVDLVGRLARGGYRLLDTQFLTSHLATFGAVEIERSDYQLRLHHTLLLESSFPTEPLQPCGVTGGAAAPGAVDGSAQPVSQTS